MVKLHKFDEYIPYGKHRVYPEDIEEVTNILRHGWLTQGPKVVEFEEKISEFLNVKNVIVVNNGTSALYLAYRANNVDQNSVLVTTPLTFLATVNAAKLMNAKINLVDIDPLTWNLSVEELSNEKKFSHVVPVHFAGLPNKLREIKTIADEREAVIIEDAAHALGAEYYGKKIGSKYSKSAIFSFHPVKHIATGEGGAIVTNDNEIAAKLRQLRSHGIIYNDFQTVEKAEKPYYYEMHDLSLNFRIPDILCGLGIKQLGRMDDNIKERNRLASIYRDLFDTWDHATYQQTNENLVNSYHIFPIKFDNIGIKARDKIFVELRKLNVGVQIHYIPVHLHPYYSGVFTKELPNTMNYYENSMTIPLYPGLNDDHLIKIFENIKYLYNEFK